MTNFFLAYPLQIFNNGSTSIHRLMVPTGLDILVIETDRLSWAPNRGFFITRSWTDTCSSGETGTLHSTGPLEVRDQVRHLWCCWRQVCLSGPAYPECEVFNQSPAMVLLKLKIVWVFHVRVDGSVLSDKCDESVYCCYDKETSSSWFFTYLFWSEKFNNLFVNFQYFVLKLFIGL